MYVEILKPLDTDNGELPIGAIVDASDWRLTRQLIEQRKVRPADPPVVEATTPTTAASTR